MMHLWLLKPYNSENRRSAWFRAYDKTFGYVIRAASETEARQIASDASGDEGQNAWLDPNQSTCQILLAKGKEGIILKDFNAA